VTTKIEILKNVPFRGGCRTTEKIRAEGILRNLREPNAEVACLIREMLTDDGIKAMGFWWIVVMHQPMGELGNSPSLLCVDRGGDGHWLRACYGKPHNRWPNGGGFAFTSSFQTA
jgi:hypothetical protein